MAERVARGADLPVLVVRAAMPPQPFARISVMAGSGAGDHAAQRYARGLATAFGGDTPRQLAGTGSPSDLEEATLVVVPQLAAAAVMGLSGAIESLFGSTTQAAGTAKKTAAAKKAAPSPKPES